VGCRRLSPYWFIRPRLRVLAEDARCAALFRKPVLGGLASTPHARRDWHAWEPLVGGPPALIGGDSEDNSLNEQASEDAGSRANGLTESLLGCSKRS